MFSGDVEILTDWLHTDRTYLRAWCQCPPFWWRIPPPRGTQSGVVHHGPHDTAGQRYSVSRTTRGDSIVKTVEELFLSEIQNTMYIENYFLTKKMHAGFTILLRIWFIQVKPKLYWVPFHGVVGVLANPDSRMLRNSQACFTNSLRSRSVAMTLPSSLLSSDLACVKWKQYIN